SPPDGAGRRRRAGGGVAEPTGRARVGHAGRAVPDRPVRGRRRRAHGDRHDRPGGGARRGGGGGSGRGGVVVGPDRHRTGVGGGGRAVLLHRGRGAGRNDPA